jgi:hypothetical protein
MGETDIKLNTKVQWIKLFNDIIKLISEINKLNYLLI